MSVQKYPTYKDSGVAWLGKVPAHWEVVKIKYIARMRSGDSITANTIEETGLYPVYGANGFRGYTSEFTHEGEKILIGRQGALCGNINYSSGKFWASEHAIVVELTAKVRTRFVGELFRAMNFNQYSTAAAQPGIGVDQITNLTIPLPPLAEQEAIAAFLDRECARIDELVAAQQRMVALLREKRQAVIAHAVTRGLDPAVALRDSGVAWLGQVPAHWEVVRLKNCLKRNITDGPHTTPEFIADGIPFLSVDGIQNGELSFEKCRYISSANHEEFKKKAFPKRDDILMGKAASTGKIARVKIDFEFSIWSPLALISLRDTYANVSFVEYWLKSSHSQFQIDQLCTMNTQKNISMDEIPTIRLPLPPLAEQEAIAAFLDAECTRIDALISAAERAVVLLQERRSAVIAAAVTGQIRVG